MSAMLNGFSGSSEPGYRPGGPIAQNAGIGVQPIPGFAPTGPNTTPAGTGVPVSTPITAQIQHPSNATINYAFTIASYDSAATQTDPYELPIKKGQLCFVESYNSEPVLGNNRSLGLVRAANLPFLQHLMSTYDMREAPNLPLWEQRKNMAPDLYWLMLRVFKHERPSEGIAVMDRLMQYLASLAKPALARQGNHPPRSSGGAPPVSGAQAGAWQLSIDSEHVGASSSAKKQRFTNLSNESLAQTASESGITEGELKFLTIAQGSVSDAEQAVYAHAFAAHVYDDVSMDTFYQNHTMFVAQDDLRSASSTGVFIVKLCEAMLQECTAYLVGNKWQYALDVPLKKLATVSGALAHFATQKPESLSFVDATIARTLAKVVAENKLHYRNSALTRSATFARDLFTLGRSILKQPVSANDLPAWTDDSSGKDTVDMYNEWLRQHSSTTLSDDTSLVDTVKDAIRIISPELESRHVWSLFTDNSYATAPQSAADLCLRAVDMLMSNMAMLSLWAQSDPECESVHAHVVNFAKRAGNLCNDVKRIVSKCAMSGQGYAKQILRWPEIPYGTLGSVMSTNVVLIADNEEAVAEQITEYATKWAKNGMLPVTDYYVNRPDEKADTDVRCAKALMNCCNSAAELAMDENPYITWYESIASEVEHTAGSHLFQLSTGVNLYGSSVKATLERGELAAKQLNAYLSDDVAPESAFTQFLTEFAPHSKQRLRRLANSLDTANHTAQTLFDKFGSPEFYETHLSETEARAIVHFAMKDNAVSRAKLERFNPLKRDTCKDNGLPLAHGNGNEMYEITPFAIDESAFDSASIVDVLSTEMQKPTSVYADPQCLFYALATVFGTEAALEIKPGSVAARLAITDLIEVELARTKSQPWSLETNNDVIGGQESFVPWPMKPGMAVSHKNYKELNFSELDYAMEANDELEFQQHAFFVSDTRKYNAHVTECEPVSPQKLIERSQDSDVGAVYFEVSAPDKMRICNEQGKRTDAYIGPHPSVKNPDHDGKLAALVSGYWDHDGVGIPFACTPTAQLMWPKKQTFSSSSPFYQSLMRIDMEGKEPAEGGSEPVGLAQQLQKFATKDYKTEMETLLPADCASLWGDNDVFVQLRTFAWYKPDQTTVPSENSCEFGFGPRPYILSALVAAYWHHSTSQAVTLPEEIAQPYAELNHQQSAFARAYVGQRHAGVGSQGTPKIEQAQLAKTALHGNVVQVVDSLLAKSAVKDTSSLQPELSANECSILRILQAGWADYGHNLVHRYTENKTNVPNPLNVSQQIARSGLGTFVREHGSITQHASTGRLTAMNTARWAMPGLNEIQPYTLGGSYFADFEHYADAVGYRSSGKLLPSADKNQMNNVLTFDYSDREATRAVHPMPADPGTLINPLYPHFKTLHLSTTTPACDGRALTVWQTEAFDLSVVSSAMVLQEQLQQLGATGVCVLNAAINNSAVHNKKQFLADIDYVRENMRLVIASAEELVPGCCAVTQRGITFVANPLTSLRARPPDNFGWDTFVEELEASGVLTGRSAGQNAPQHWTDKNPQYLFENFYANRPTYIKGAILKFVLTEVYQDAFGMGVAKPTVSHTNPPIRTDMRQTSDIELLRSQISSVVRLAATCSAKPVTEQLEFCQRLQQQALQEALHSNATATTVARVAKCGKQLSAFAAKIANIGARIKADKKAADPYNLCARIDETTLQLRQANGANWSAIVPVAAEVYQHATNILSANVGSSFSTEDALDVSTQATPSGFLANWSYVNSKAAVELFSMMSGIHASLQTLWGTTDTNQVTKMSQRIHRITKSMSVATLVRSLGLVVSAANNRFANALSDTLTQMDNGNSPENAVKTVQTATKEINNTLEWVKRAARAVSVQEGARLNSEVARTKNFSAAATNACSSVDLYSALAGAMTKYPHENKQTVSEETVNRCAADAKHAQSLLQKLNGTPFVTNSCIPVAAATFTEAPHSSVGTCAVTNFVRAYMRDHDHDVACGFVEDCADNKDECDSILLNDANHSRVRNACLQSSTIEGDAGVLFDGPFRFMNRGSGTMAATSGARGYCNGNPQSARKGKDDVQRTGGIQALEDLRAGCESADCAFTADGDIASAINSAVRIVSAYAMHESGVPASDVGLSAKVTELLSTADDSTVSFSTHIYDCCSLVSQQPRSSGLQNEIYAENPALLLCSADKTNSTLVAVQKILVQALRIVLRGVPSGTFECSVERLMQMRKPLARRAFLPDSQQGSLPLGAGLGPTDKLAADGLAGVSATDQQLYSLLGYEMPKEPSKDPFMCNTQWESVSPIDAIGGVPMRPTGEIQDACVSEACKHLWRPVTADAFALGLSNVLLYSSASLRRKLFQSVALYTGCTSHDGVGILSQLNRSGQKRAPLMQQRSPNAPTVSTPCKQHKYTVAQLSDLPSSLLHITVNNQELPNLNALKRNYTQESDNLQLHLTKRSLAIHDALCNSLPAATETVVRDTHNHKAVQWCTDVKACHSAQWIAQLFGAATQSTRHTSGETFASDGASPAGSASAFIAYLYQAYKAPLYEGHYGNVTVRAEMCNVRQRQAKCVSWSNRHVFNHNLNQLYLAESIAACKQTETLGPAVGASNAVDGWWHAAKAYTLSSHGGVVYQSNTTDLYTRGNTETDNAQTALGKIQDAMAESCNSIAAVLVKSDNLPCASTVISESICNFYDKSSSYLHEFDSYSLQKEWVSVQRTLASHKGAYHANISPLMQTYSKEKLQFQKTLSERNAPSLQLDAGTTSATSKSTTPLGLSITEASAGSLADYYPFAASMHAAEGLQSAKRLTQAITHLDSPTSATLLCPDTVNDAIAQGGYEASTYNQICTALRNDVRRLKMSGDAEQTAEQVLAVESAVRDALITGPLITTARYGFERSPDQPWQGSCISGEGLLKRDQYVRKQWMRAFGADGLAFGQNPATAGVRSVSQCLSRLENPMDRWEVARLLPNHSKLLQTDTGMLSSVARTSLQSTVDARDMTTEQRTAHETAVRRVTTEPETAIRAMAALAEGSLATGPKSLKLFKADYVQFDVDKDSYCPNNGTVAARASNGETARALDQVSEASLLFDVIPSLTAVLMGDLLSLDRIVSERSSMVSSACALLEASKFLAPRSKHDHATPQVQSSLFCNVWGIKAEALDNAGVTTALLDTYTGVRDPLSTARLLVDAVARRISKAVCFLPWNATNAFADAFCNRHSNVANTPELARLFYKAKIFTQIPNKVDSFRNSMYSDVLRLAVATGNSCAASCISAQDCVKYGPQRKDKLLKMFTQKAGLVIDQSLQKVTQQLRAPDNNVAILQGALNCSVAATQLQQKSVLQNLGRLAEGTQSLENYSKFVHASSEDMNLGAAAIGEIPRLSGIYGAAHVLSCCSECVRVSSYAPLVKASNHVAALAHAQALQPVLCADFECSQFVRNSYHTTARTAVNALASFYDSMAMLAAHNVDMSFGAAAKISSNLGDWVADQAISGWTQAVSQLRAAREHGVDVKFDTVAHASATKDELVTTAFSALATFLAAYCAQQLTGRRATTSEPLGESATRFVIDETKALCGIVDGDLPAHARGTFEFSEQDHCSVEECFAIVKATMQLPADLASSTAYEAAHGPPVTLEHARHKDTSFFAQPLEIWARNCMRTDCFRERQMYVDERFPESSISSVHALLMPFATTATTCSTLAFVRTDTVTEMNPTSVAAIARSLQTWHATAAAVDSETQKISTGVFKELQQHLADNLAKAKKPMAVNHNMTDMATVDFCTKCLDGGNIRVSDLYTRLQNEGTEQFEETVAEGSAVRLAARNRLHKTLQQIEENRDAIAGAVGKVCADLAFKCAIMRTALRMMDVDVGTDTTNLCNFKTGSLQMAVISSTSHTLAKREELLHTVLPELSRNAAAWASNALYERVCSATNGAMKETHSCLANLVVRKISDHIVYDAWGESLADEQLCVQADRQNTAIESMSATLVDEMTPTLTSTSCSKVAHPVCLRADSANTNEWLIPRQMAAKEVTTVAVAANEFAQSTSATVSNFNVPQSMLPTKDDLADVGQHADILHAVHIHDAFPAEATAMLSATQILRDRMAYHMRVLGQSPSSPDYKDVKVQDANFSARWLESSTGRRLHSNAGYHTENKSQYENNGCDSSVSEDLAKLWSVAAHHADKCLQIDSFCSSGLGAASAALFADNVQDTALNANQYDSLLYNLETLLPRRDHISAVGAVSVVDADETHSGRAMYQTSMMSPWVSEFDWIVRGASTFHNDHCYTGQEVSEQYTQLCVNLFAYASSTDQIKKNARESENAIFGNVELNSLSSLAHRVSTLASRLKVSAKQLATRSKSMVLQRKMQQGLAQMKLYTKTLRQASHALHGANVRVTLNTVRAELSNALKQIVAIESFHFRDDDMIPASSLPRPSDLGLDFTNWTEVAAGYVAWNTVHTTLLAFADKIKGNVNDRHTNDSSLTITIRALVENMRTNSLPSLGASLELAATAGVGPPSAADIEALQNNITYRAEQLGALLSHTVAVHKLCTTPLGMEDDSVCVADMFVAAAKCQEAAYVHMKAAVDSALTHVPVSAEAMCAVATQAYSDFALQSIAATYTTRSYQSVDEWALRSCVKSVCTTPENAKHAEVLAIAAIEACCRKGTPLVNFGRAILQCDACTADIVASARTMSTSNDVSLTALLQSTDAQNASACKRRALTALLHIDKGAVFDKGPATVLRSMVRMHRGEPIFRSVCASGVPELCISFGTDLKPQSEPTLSKIYLLLTAHTNEGLTSIDRTQPGLWKIRALPTSLQCGGTVDSWFPLANEDKITAESPRIWQEPNEQTGGLTVHVDAAVHKERPIVDKMLQTYAHGLIMPTFCASVCMMTLEHNQKLTHGCKKSNVLAAGPWQGAMLRMFAFRPSDGNWTAAVRNISDKARYKLLPQVFRDHVDVKTSSESAHLARLCALACLQPSGTRTQSFALQAATKLRKHANTVAPVTLQDITAVKPTRSASSEPQEVQTAEEYEMPPITFGTDAQVTLGSALVNMTDKMRASYSKLSDASFDNVTERQTSRGIVDVNSNCTRVSPGSQLVEATHIHGILTASNIATSVMPSQGQTYAVNAFLSGIQSIVDEEAYGSESQPVTLHDPTFVSCMNPVAISQSLQVQLKPNDDNHLQNVERTLLYLCNDAVGPLLYNPICIDERNHTLLADTMDCYRLTANSNLLKDAVSSVVCTNRATSDLQKYGGATCDAAALSTVLSSMVALAHTADATRAEMVNTGLALLNSGLSETTSQIGVSTNLSSELQKCLQMQSRAVSNQKQKRATLLSALLDTPSTQLITSATKTLLSERLGSSGVSAVATLLSDAEKTPTTAYAPGICALTIPALWVQSNAGTGLCETGAKTSFTSTPLGTAWSARYQSVYNIPDMRQAASASQLSETVSALSEIANRGVPHSTMTTVEKSARFVPKNLFESLAGAVGIAQHETQSTTDAEALLNQFAQLGCQSTAIDTRSATQATRFTSQLCINTKTCNATSFQELFGNVPSRSTIDASSMAQNHEQFCDAITLGATSCLEAFALSLSQINLHQKKLDAAIASESVFQWNALLNEKTGALRTRLNSSSLLRALGGSHSEVARWCMSTGPESVPDVNTVAETKVLAEVIKFYDTVSQSSKLTHMPAVLRDIANCNSIKEFATRHVPTLQAAVQKADDYTQDLQSTQHLKAASELDVQRDIASALWSAYLGLAKEGFRTPQTATATRNGSSYGLQRGEHNDVERACNARLTHNNIAFQHARDLQAYADSMPTLAAAAGVLNVNPHTIGQAVKTVNCTATYSESFSSLCNSYTDALRLVCHQSAVLAQIMGAAGKICAGRNACQQSADIAQAVSDLSKAQSVDQRCHFRTQMFALAGLDIVKLDKTADQFASTQMNLVTEEQAKTALTQTVDALPDELTHGGVVKSHGSLKNTDAFLHRVQLSNEAVACIVPPVSISETASGMLVHFVSSGSNLTPGTKDLLVGPTACVMRASGGAAGIAFLQCSQLIAGFHASIALGKQLGQMCAEGFSPNRIRAELGGFVGLESGKFGSMDRGEASAAVRVSIAASCLTMGTPLFYNEDMSSSAGGKRLLVEHNGGLKTQRKRMTARNCKKISACLALYAQRPALSVWLQSKATNATNLQMLAEQMDRPDSTNYEPNSSIYDEALQCDILATSIQKTTRPVTLVASAVRTLVAAVAAVNAEIAETAACAVPRVADARYVAEAAITTYACAPGLVSLEACKLAAAALGPGSRGMSAVEHAWQCVGRMCFLHNSSYSVGGTDIVGFAINVHDKQNTGIVGAVLPPAHALPDAMQHRTKQIKYLAYNVTEATQLAQKLAPYAISAALCCALQSVKRSNAAHNVPPVTTSATSAKRPADAIGQYLPKVYNYQRVFSDNPRDDRSVSIWRDNRTETLKHLYANMEEVFAIDTAPTESDSMFWGTDSGPSSAHGMTLGALMKRHATGFAMQQRNPSKIASVWAPIGVVQDVTSDGGPTVRPNPNVAVVTIAGRCQTFNIWNNPSVGDYLWMVLVRVNGAKIRKRYIENAGLSVLGSSLPATGILTIDKEEGIGSSLTSIEPDLSEEDTRTAYGQNSYMNDWPFQYIPVHTKTSAPPSWEQITGCYCSPQYQIFRSKDEIAAFVDSLLENVDSDNFDKETKIGQEIQAALISKDSAPLVDLLWQGVQASMRAKSQDHHSRKDTVVGKQHLFSESSDILQYADLREAVLAASSRGGAGSSASLIEMYRANVFSDLIARYQQDEEKAQLRQVASELSSLLMESVAAGMDQLAAEGRSPPSAPPDQYAVFAQTDALLAQHKYREMLVERTDEQVGQLIWQLTKNLMTLAANLNRGSFNLDEDLRDEELYSDVYKYFRDVFALFERNYFVRADNDVIAVVIPTMIAAVMFSAYGMRQEQLHQEELPEAPTTDLPASGDEVLKLLDPGFVNKEYFAAQFQECIDPLITGTVLNHSQMPFATIKIGRCLTPSAHVTENHLFEARYSQAREATLPMIEVELGIGRPRSVSPLASHVYAQGAIYEPPTGLPESAERYARPARSGARFYGQGAAKATPSSATVVPSLTVPERLPQSYGRRP